ISPRLRRPNEESGAMLILALWALLLLSAAVFAWVKFLDAEISVGSEANLGLEAKALAHTGVAVALHPLVSQQTALLSDTLAPERSYKATLVGEGGKLNLNWLLAGEDPKHRELLKNFLSRAGLGFEEQDVLIDCLLDWVDPDATKHLNGMEESPDYHPPNRPLQSLDEVAQVHGSKPLVSQPDWRNYFTLLSQGPIDLTSAPVEVLRAVPGIGDARAARFLQIRQGPDGKDGTKDDHIFKDVGEVRSFLGFSEQQFQELAGLVTMKDPTVHITSEGRAGKVYRQIEVVARKVSGNPNILLWKEF
ncbi:MAG: general secretion pathway protein GspK, partial [Verrucomicrobiota bacterium]|nr:general secretion pathway protein GspK [Verrucomicrobiota bacterium]